MVLTEAQFAKIDTAASGATQLVAAVAGAKIRVLSFLVVTAGAVTVKFVSGASPDLTGAMSLTTGKPVADVSPHGVLETAPGAALNIVLGAGVQASGWLVYALVS